MVTAIFEIETLFFENKAILDVDKLTAGQTVRLIKNTVTTPKIGDAYFAAIQS